MGGDSLAAANGQKSATVSLRLRSEEVSAFRGEKHSVTDESGSGSNAALDLSPGLQAA